MRVKNICISLLAFLMFTISACIQNIEPLAYKVILSEINIDGDASDWEEIKGNTVQGKEHLWYGQGMKAENWEGNSDLSYQWKAAWSGNKLFFMVRVVDDTISNFDQPNSWLNDCVEICIDPHNTKGPVINNSDHNNVAVGYETHFLPDNPPKSFISALISEYETNNPQDSVFENKWEGEVEVAYTDDGYIIEIAFSIPELTLEKGLEIGIVYA